MRLTARHLFHAARRLFFGVVAFLCSAVASTAWADPPGRVGRLGEMSGQVWLYTPDAGEWIAAVRNRPLTTGDRVATDADARAELRVGSTTVRLDGGTELEVLRIDDDRIALQLHSGTTAVRLRSAESAREFELETAEGRFTARRAGRYRFDRSDETSQVTVWSGEALYEGPGSALTVYGNQRAEFWLDRENAAQYSLTEPERDSFASWNGERDRQDDRSASTQYVSPEMTGVEDLDRHGRWEQGTEYGAVWVPRAVPAGWAPYSAGHWAWVSPWGWTWVDDAPWGFAPFHYGRWVMHRQRWCWAPGTYVRHPVYAPALVGWVGGPHLSVNISIGGHRHGPAVGWFPLAPREVYVPTYRVSPGYVQQVNITHVTHITNVTTIVNNPQQAVTNIDYRHRRHPHAITVVPQSVLTSRQAVGPAAAQWRGNPAVRKLVGEQGRGAVVSAPPVAAPVITPAIAEARRMRIHDPERARPGRQLQAPAVQPAMPPSPSRMNSPAARALIDADTRVGFGDQQRQQQQLPRRRDMREDPRSAHTPAQVVVPTAPSRQVSQTEERRMRAHPVTPSRAERPDAVVVQTLPGRAPQASARPMPQVQAPAPVLPPPPRPPTPAVQPGAEAQVPHERARGRGQDRPGPRQMDR